MILNATDVDGAWLIDIERREDERGFFARVWCRQELATRQLNSEVAQASISYNRLRGTLRGLHFQQAPHAETKIVRCTRGAVFDVIVDLRPHSPTFRGWQGFKLTAENYRAVYVPKGVAHGFQTLVDDTEVVYQISTPYAPEAAGGHRYDDPAFAISWPIQVSVVSSRDLAWPAFATDHAAIPNL
jgi:dTDP-4-dehydrorhamnose 3,5-epimerase